MAQRLEPRTIRLLIIAAIFILLNVILFTLYYFLPTWKSPNSLTKLPVRGESLTARFQKSGLSFNNPDAQFGLIIFTGKNFTPHLTPILNELKFLEKQPVEILICTIAKPEAILGDQAHSKISIITDSSSQKCQEFGVTKENLSVILVEKNELQSRAFYHNLSEFDKFQEALLKVNYILNSEIVAAKSEQADDRHLSNAGLELAHFPFDSLIEHAEERTINLDEVPQQELKLVRHIGHEENPAPDGPIFSQPISMAINSNDKIYITDYGENHIITCSLNGKVLDIIGRKGQGPGEFIRPLSIHINPEDEI